jgi:hypothetical protein
MFFRRLLALSFGALLVSTVACGEPASSDASADPEGEWSADVIAKTDAQVKADIEAAAAGNLYVSESDYPFTWVEAKLEGQKSVTQELVRAKLASYVDNDADADKPMSSLVAMNGDWPEWKRDYLSCDANAYPGPEECAKMKVMNDALEKNLRGIKVMYFGSRGTRGHVDGTAVTVFIVGRTPAGNLAGVRTIAIWT